jgi:acid phosphatase family membrane protein YuiD
MKECSYALTPFLAWLIAGILKFLINSLRTRRFTFDLIGYGGLPSNHAAIVSSIATLIALKEGINTPAFGVAIALAFIVILDASSLRKQVGQHAVALNKLSSLTTSSPLLLRERMGHTFIEILAGVITGSVVAYSVLFLVNRS